MRNVWSVSSAAPFAISVAVGPAFAEHAESGCAFGERNVSV